ncbi:hypothetical protein NLC82_02100 [Candidatus Aminicenantes bacterium AC-335-A11]|jgi:hypothetical protein|nr:hypothetical protein [SCandidatus Aminicenantes bacterium Aminicenantia_JdfR_composite]MCP2596426.1 hypothetical protein [Candidatus Aminicenantes bacterium AC-335-G13]MCP2618196.1 hypothetical protein [Candidatus Aminicenantes bacterium AC-335-A11]MCP2621005.1 hypothetical protein [Candidatus Aminicenantes bacterium AC-334-E05]
MKKIILFIIIFTILFSVSKANEKKFVIGIGGGYAVGLTEGLFKYFNIYWPNELMLKEDASMKYNLSFNIQYFFRPDIGILGEYTYQKASYFCHLEWYELNGVVETPTGWHILEHYPINYIEEPYEKFWSIHSIYLMGIYQFQDYRKKNFFPYLMVGLGVNIIAGNRYYVLERSRLGASRISFGTKICGGIKYYFKKKSKYGLNLRFFSIGIKRREIGWILRTYTGPSQFDITEMFLNNKVKRYPNLVEKVISYMGIDLSIEYKF